MRIEVIIILLFLTLKAYASGLDSTAQSKMDSLSAIVNSPASHDTSLAQAYSVMSDVIYYSHADSSKVLSEKAKLIAERGLLTDLSASEKISFQRTLAKALNMIGHFYDRNSRIPEARDFYKQSLQIQEAINDKKGIANSLNDIGYLSKSQGSISEALDYFNRSYKIQEEINDSRGIARSLNNIALIYFSQGSIPKALEYFGRSLKIREAIGDKRMVATCLSNIGYIYRKQGDFSEALSYQKRGLALRQELDDKDGIANSLSHIGFIYSQEDSIDKALDYYHRSLKINQEISDKPSIARCLHNIGHALKKHGQITAALDYYDQSLRLKEEIGDKPGIATSLNNIAGLKLDQGKIDGAQGARATAERSLLIARELGFPEHIRNTSLTLHKIEKQSKNFDTALEYYELYIQMRDSISNEANTKATVKQQLSYEYEKEKLALQKEQEKEVALSAAKLQQQRILIYAALAGLLIVLLLAGFIFKERRKSEKLLLNILPESTSKELKSKGKVQPRYYEKATVLFTDFVGFTVLSEQLTPEALVSELDHIFKAFDRIISGYGIEKIKTIGDAYMACGGIPVENSSHPVDVVKAAIDIKHFMKNYATKRAQEKRPYFQARIGIHTGPIVAGVVGEKKFAYDIWGDTVNTASRMESSGAAGKVNISGDTFELIKEQFSCTHRGKINAKNKGEIDMYFVEV